MNTEFTFITQPITCLSTSFYPAKERRIEKKSFDLKIKLHDNKFERNTQYNILWRTYLSENIWTNGLFAV